MSLKLDYQIGSATHAGKVRLENQDRCASFSLPNSKGCVILVADGMGGHKGGSIAAEIATESICTVFNKPFRKPEQALKESLISAQSKMVSRVAKIPEFKDMGTTVSVVCYFNNKVHAAHIGDSRIYKFNSTDTTQISTDHSFVQEMIRQGVLTPKQARNHPDDNVLVRALTASFYDPPDIINPIQPNAGDVFLVCSDGLWKMLTDDEMQKVVINKDAQEAADELVDMANANGGVDNISVSILKIIPIKP